MRKCLSAHFHGETTRPIAAAGPADPSHNRTAPTARLPTAAFARFGSAWSVSGGPSRRLGTRLSHPGPGRLSPPEKGLRCSRWPVGHVRLVRRAATDRPHRRRRRVGPVAWGAEHSELTHAHTQWAADVAARCRQVRPAGAIAGCDALLTYS